MHTLDYVVLCLFFLVVVGIGLTAIRKIKSSKDYFVAGGKAPWWLAGISHHVSGYSGVVFVAYAAVAYQVGFAIYIWFSVQIALCVIIGAYVFAPRWARLRIKASIESPTEYLATRYSVASQQLMAWSGVLLKVFDIGAKWASLGILLNGFTGLPLSAGILFSGGLSLVYVTVGGLWADLYTDFVQFIVQLVGGIVLLCAVLKYFGGPSAVFTIWKQLPPDHAQPFNPPFTAMFLVGGFLGTFLSYNGGTWNLAGRYIAAPSGRSARKSAFLSGWLYAFWPLIIFFPMWAAPLVFPHVADPTRIYPMLALRFLPAGLVGLVLAAMFAATMSMTTSDANTISAVITRDILPRTLPHWSRMTKAQCLRVARISTFIFTAMTLVVAIEAPHFGGVLGLTITWFLALVGPISIPMLFGLLPIFKHADSRAAVASIVAGLIAFVGVNWFHGGQTASVSIPTFSSAGVYSFLAWARRKQPVPAVVEELMRALASDAPGVPDPALASALPS